MGLLRNLKRVRRARERMTMAHTELQAPGKALLARGRRYPLTSVGAAGGAGFVLGQLNVHPLNVPGLGSLLSGSLAEAVALGTRLIAELGLAGAGSDDQGGGG